MEYKKYAQIELDAYRIWWVIFFIYSSSSAKWHVNKNIII